LNHDSQDISITHRPPGHTHPPRRPPLLPPAILLWRLCQTRRLSTFVHIPSCSPHPPSHIATIMHVNAEAGPSRLRAPSSPPMSLDSVESTRPKRRRLDPDDEDDESLPTPPSSITPQLRGGGKQARGSRAARPGRGNRDDTPERKRPPDGASRKRVTRARARRNSSPSIATDLESIASEDAAVRAEIHRLELGLRDVQGDGNCLFRALADQLWGNQKRHVEVRKVVCDYLEVCRNSMEAFVRPFLREDEGETYEMYVERMRQPSRS
jgi:hypothetical protein